MEKIINKFICVLKKSLVPLILFSVVYVIGFIFGIIFYVKNCDVTIFYKNVLDYHIIIFDSTVSVFNCFIKCLLVGFLLTIPIFLFGLSNYTIPFSGIIIFYRGLILGICLITFYNLSKIYGIFIFIIFTLPSHFIITLGLIIATVLNYRLRENCKINERWKDVLKNCLISVLFAIISAIYMLFMLIVIVRPINQLF